MRVRLVALALVAAFAGIYLQDLGHGFIRDDFGWIASSRIASPTDAIRLFTQQPGFYRPLVSLTFSADYALWRLNPLGYAFTNLALFAIAAGLVYRLARTLMLSASAALFVVGVWAFDIHAPRMALLWISGRTALMLCIFALATADATLRRRYKTAGVLCLLALLSKEEAVLLPALMTVFLWWDGRSKDSLATTLKTVWPMWVALGIYAVLRLNSGAFGPSSLPEHYPVIESPGAFIGNVGEYAVRAGLVSSIAALVVTVAGRPWIPLQQSERRAIVFGALWAAAFFGLTIFAANRSDLYALTPSLGFAVAAAALASCAFRSNPARVRLACTGLIAAAFLLIPVYWQRDRRWVAPADVSAYVTRTIANETTLGPHGRIVMVDDISLRYGLESAFGTLLPEAVRLVKGSGWSGELRRTDERCGALVNQPGSDVFVFREERLVRCR